MKETKKYLVIIFLLTEASVPRITNIFLDAGFTVEPNLSGNNGDGKLFDKGLVSTVMCTLVSTKQDKFSDEEKVNQFLFDAMVAAEIPFYGSFLSSPPHNSRYSSGHMKAPTKKLKPTIEPGSYKNNENNVIELQRKDDGIIDG